MNFAQRSNYLGTCCASDLYRHHSCCCSINLPAHWSVPLHMNLAPKIEVKVYVLPSALHPSVSDNTNRDVPESGIQHRLKINGSIQPFDNTLVSTIPCANHSEVLSSKGLTNLFFPLAYGMENEDRIFSQPETTCLNQSSEDPLMPEAERPNFLQPGHSETQRQRLSNSKELNELRQSKRPVFGSNFESIIGPEVLNADPNLKSSVQHSVDHEYDQLTQERYVPLKNLKNLYYLLLKFFKNQEIIQSDIASLKNFELEILNLIVKRKYETKLFNNEHQKKDAKLLVQTLESFQSKLAVKRPEESYKFIFTRAIKYLKRVFKSKQHLSSQFPDRDSQFYNYYFGDMAHATGLPLESFIYPQPASLNSGRYKSLNLDYFKHVFLCDQFIHDLRHYLASEMRSDYELEIDRKTQQLLVKWDEQFASAKESAEALGSYQGMSKKLYNEISRYFLQNKRCKLPWSVVELNNAITRLNSLFIKLVKNEDPEIST